MSQPNETNGKSTAALVIQIASVLIVIIAGVATPLILMYAKVSSLELQFSEVETQFRAARFILRNSSALLWQKTYGEPFPSEVYFPSIAKK